MLFSLQNLFYRYCMHQTATRGKYMAPRLIGTGTVTGLAVRVDGKSHPIQKISFDLSGPYGDDHYGQTRTLGKHDGDYLKSSELTGADNVFNWRSWTGLSDEEVTETETLLDYPIPLGTVFENIRISGIPNFSKLAPTTRLVFPRRFTSQAILAVWEENEPCRTAGEEVAMLYKEPKLVAKYVKAALNRRGVMGFVLSAGQVCLGDEVRVYAPVT
jgi:hypothetical protein